MTAAANDLRQLIGLVEAKAALLPRIVPEDWSSYARRRNAVENLGRELASGERARVMLDGSVPSITMAGIRSTSTMGFEGALRNWLTAARNRLAAMEGAA